jgi:hypothetical protein
MFKQILAATLCRFTNDQGEEHMTDPLLVDAGCAERGCIGYDPRDGDAVLMATRNDTLEEVAKEFDKMPFGDTVASFAIFVRNMKK